MISRNIVRNRTFWLVLSVFVLCLAVRLYWICQKDGLYGDEQTSLSLAYNVEGWGSKSYEEGRIYSAEELRRILYIDDDGGWNGYTDDIKSLWNDNRDKSHASLYYMALRTVLIGQDLPNPKPVIWRGCGLNLLFFTISFFCLGFLSRFVFKNKPWLIAVVLLFAFCNPLSVSTTLLLREYSLAECLISAFSLMSVGLVGRIINHKMLLKPSIIVRSALLIACVLSAGYFNLIFVILVCLYLLWKSGRQSNMNYKNLIYFTVTALLSVALCVLMYRGYFNFIADDRTAEVIDKVEGNSFISNLYISLKSGIGMLVRNVVGLPLVVWALGVTVFLIMKKQNVEKIPFQGVFVVAVVWITIVLVLSTWKMTRYIAPCVPLLMIAMAYYMMQFSEKMHRNLMIVPIALFLLFAFSGDGIEYLMKGDEKFAEFPESKRLLLYATYDGDRNTLPLLTPYLTDEQECLIISDTKEIFTQSLPTDSVVYVFADKNMDALFAADGFQSKYPFNGWQDIYIFRRK